MSAAITRARIVLTAANRSARADLPTPGIPVSTTGVTRPSGPGASSCPRLASSASRPLNSGSLRRRTDPGFRAPPRRRGGHDFPEFVHRQHEVPDAGHALVADLSHQARQGLHAPLWLKRAVDGDSRRSVPPGP